MPKFLIAAFMMLTTVLWQCPESFAATREETLQQLFKQVNATTKGALGKNAYQKANGRIEVLYSGGGLPGGTIFTVAFRNEVAAKLAASGFYVGNRFTSNYWELHNKYLATPAEQKRLAFNQDPARFLANGTMAPEAFTMIRDTLIERFYMLKFPKTRLAMGNNQRGTSDADNEAEYGQRFAQYLAKWMANDSDYVVLYDLERRINASGNGLSLANLRDEVAGIYDRMLSEFISQDALKTFYGIRNSIHNYMTPDVLARLDDFVKTYGNSVSGQDVASIRSMRAKIASYYAIDKKTLVAATKALGTALPDGSLALVTSLADRTNPFVKLEALSWLVTQARASFMATRNPAVIDWMVKANGFITIELTSRTLKSEDFAQRARISLDGAYSAGLVSADQWSKVRTAFASPQPTAEYMKARIDDMSRVFAAAQTAITQAMGSALTDWETVEPASEGYVDDTLRSSLLTELNQISAAIAKQMPKSAAKFEIENEGEGFGYLVYLPAGASADEVAKLDKTMLPIFAELPIEVGLVAGIITEAPQTSLSHVNIKSKARGTPNVFYPNISKDPTIKDFIARRALVRIFIKNGNVDIREASLDEAKAFWRKAKAPVQVTLHSDLSEKRIVSTKDLHSKDVLRYGTKASNYGEAERVLPAGVMREGLGIPFYYYDEYMRTTTYDGQKTLSDRMKEIAADPRSLEDHDYLVQELKDLQKSITADEKPINPALINELQQRLNALYPGLAVRFRSSTNSEDLPNFSGAGLYDSFTYDPTKPKKTIQYALKHAWASTWNVRTFDERQLFGIPHMSVYMGILVSPSFPKELANGVGVSRNIEEPKLGAGFFVNTQVGEDAVTNPDPKTAAEGVVVIRKPDPQTKLPYTFHYLHYSTLSPNKPILAPEELATLSNYIFAMHKQFKKVFDPNNKNPNFAVDVEWKIDDMEGQRKVYVKQCRPYVTN